jgi:hypothetical protein
VERFIRGAPFLAPLLFTNMGTLGLSRCRTRWRRDDMQGTMRFEALLARYPPGRARKERLNGTMTDNRCPISKGR